MENSISEDVADNVSSESRYIITNVTNDFVVLNNTTVISSFEDFFSSS